MLGTKRRDESLLMKNYSLEHQMEQDSPGSYVKVLLYLCNKGREILEYLMTESSDVAGELPQKLYFIGATSCLIIARGFPDLSLVMLISSAKC